MSIALSEIVQCQWTSWGFGSPPVDLSWMMLTGGSRSINKVVGLVFSSRQTEPHLAVKLPRVPESLPGLIREAETLAALEAFRPGAVPGVPRLLFCDERRDPMMVGETALAGQPISTLLHRDNAQAIALQASNWVANLARSFGSAPESPDAWWDRLIEPVMADFEQQYGEVVDPGMLQETRRLLTGLGALPLVPEQRDFAPWNVLLTPGGELAVLDWESAELRGLPALDLIYFLTYLAFQLDGAEGTSSRRSSYRAALNPSTVTGRIVAESLAHYAALTCLDPAAFAPLRLLTWLVHSRSEYRQLEGDAAGRPDLESLRNSLFVGLWKEELEHGAGTRSLRLRAQGRVSHGG
jgi:hypothetical protein